MKEDKIDQINIDEALEATLGSGDMMKECGMPMIGAMTNPMAGGLLPSILNPMDSISRITVAIPASDILAKGQSDLTPMSIHGNGFDDASVKEIAEKIITAAGGDKNKMRIMIMKLKHKLDILDNPRSM